MKRILLAMAAAWSLSAHAMAENVPVVVELFTSQGCSSCPPADEMMEVLTERDDVIALSLHVDYWDYIGWKDEFADPGHAERQRAYAAQAGRRSVYTPEMIVNGESDIVGAKPMELAMVIEEHKQAAREVVLALKNGAGDTVQVDVKALRDGLRPMDVLMLRYQPARVARITRGENAGRTIEYLNVAQDWQMLAKWDGRAPLSLDAEAPGGHPVVVLVQESGNGPIRAAARLTKSGK